MCLNSEAGRPCLPENYVRVLVFTLRSIGRYPHPGFTITYRDFNKPEIMKVSLVPDEEALLDLTRSTHWQNPTISRNPSVPLIDVGLYHSTLLDQSFSSPTSSNPSMPLSTGMTFNPSAVVTVSTVRPATTQVQVAHDTILSVFMTPAPEPTGTPAINPNIQANRPMKIIEHVFNVFETKAKEFVHVAMEARPHIDAQNFLSSEIAAGVRKFKDLEAISNEIITTADHIAPFHDELDSVTSSLTSDRNIPPVSSASPSGVTSQPSTSANPSTLRTVQAVRAFQITSVIIIIVALSTFIFVYLFRNPRRRADRAACAEERRRRRLYKRAARQHRWRSWLGRLRGTFVPRHVGPTAETWEEKQFIATETDSPSLSEMRRELRALRTAHTIVDGIVRAEEGRTDGSSFISRVRRVERRTRTYSGSTADSVGPPPYEESVTLVDGFQYTPNGTDSTPDSSVIDTSPRTSLYLSNSDSEKD